MIGEETAPPLMVAPLRLDTLHEPPPPAPPPQRRGRHAVTSHRRRHPRRRLFLVALAVLIASAGTWVGIRLSSPGPAPTVTSALTRAFSLPSRPVTLPWPSTGQAAVAIPAIGVNVSSGPELPVPVASLTKLMTAFVVLRDHPLAPGQSGPTITVAPVDVFDYKLDILGDDTNANVVLGEQLTERQLLSGLLVHSADNYADMLARWDAGSIAAFVDKMNVAASTLGMSHTHFADASGIASGSQSTASDMLKVAASDMENPVFTGIVKMPSVTLPVAGTLSTYDPLLGVDGVLGVKSGFTTAAGGCDVLGVVHTVDGRRVLVLAAVTGQTGAEVLAQAGLHGLALADAATALVQRTPVLAGDQVVARVREVGRTVRARTVSAASVLTWPGVTVRRVFRPAHGLSDQARRGDRVGTVVVTLGTQRVLVPVRLEADVPRPSILQRVLSSA